MEKTILEYGIVGAILLYFLWKDKSTFEMYKNYAENDWFTGSYPKRTIRIKKRCGGD